MQLANAALGSTGTARHLIFRPFDRSFFRGIVTFHHRLDSYTSLLQVVLARLPYRFPFIQGSSADVIQLPDIRFSRFST